MYNIYMLLSRLVDPGYQQDVEPKDYLNKQNFKKIRRKTIMIVNEIYQDPKQGLLVLKNVLRRRL